MNKPYFARSRKIAALSLTVVGALAAGSWWYAQQPQESYVQDSQGMSASHTAPVEPAEPSTSKGPAKPMASMELRLDGANRLVEHEPEPAKKTSKPAETTGGVDAQTSDTFVENERSDSLDLNVQNAFEAPDHARPQVASATPSARPNPLDVSKFQKQAPEVESYNLFKSEYGLRGFMKQNWINQRVALLGGLGLNDDRLIETEDDDLRDDIAFGMGLIVAF